MKPFLKLNRNENPYGPAPAVMKALRNFKKEHAFMYLEGYYNSNLVKEISKTFKVPEDRVILYYGIEDFIRNLFSQLNSKKDSILTNENCFAYFDIFAHFKKLKIHHFRLKEGSHTFESDLEDCLEKVKKYRPKVIIITTPNNPTGHRTLLKDIEKIIHAASKETIFLIDETYFGLYPNNEEKIFQKILVKYPNIAFLRTFSKFYGLAGLRVGFGICGKGFKKMIGYESRFLNFSRILEEAAIAALKSKNFYSKIAKKICRDRDWFIGEVNKLKNFKTFESHGNFVLVKIASKKINLFKKFERREKTIISKWLSKNSFRISIGKTNHLQKLLKSLKKIDTN